jgi:hypothetical protein
MYDTEVGLLCFRQDASGWHSETLGFNGGHNSLILDGGGYPHVSYYGAGLEYAYRDAAGWHTEGVLGGTGFFTSLALDGDSYPHISYYRSSYGHYQDLKYAYKDTIGWHIEIVDSEGDIGAYTSIALDATGRPHISYYDGSNRDLKYAIYVEAEHTIYLPRALRESR